MIEPRTSPHTGSGIDYMSIRELVAVRWEKLLPEVATATITIVIAIRADGRVVSLS